METRNLTRQNAPQREEPLSIKDIWSLCINHWQWFAIAVAACLLVATFYILKTTPVYSRGASVLIKEDSKGRSVSADITAAFSDLGFFGGSCIFCNFVGKTNYIMDVIRQKFPQFDEAGQALIGKAYKIAEAALSGKTRENGRPFLDHPMKTALIATDEIGLPAECAAAVFLHEAMRMDEGAFGRV